MKPFLKKLWRALVLFWTVLGAFVFFVVLVTVLYSLGFQKWKSAGEISTEEYCHQHPVGSTYKAVDLASDWHHIQLKTGRLVSSVATIELTRNKLSDENHQKALSTLRQIDEQGLPATLWITDTVFLLKKTCEISFEHGLVSKADYRTWD